MKKVSMIQGSCYYKSYKNTLLDFSSDRVMRISLVHDMAESIVGDLTPHCGVSNEEKHEREVAAMEHFSKLVGEKAGNEMFNLFLVRKWFDYFLHSFVIVNFICLAKNKYIKLVFT